MNFKTFFSTAAVATVLMTAQAFAADITVSQPWARASAGMAKAGAAFMVINNAGDADTLISAKGDVSKRIELHTHTMVDGVMQMRQVEGGIEIPAKGAQYLKPGSYHVMLMGLAAPLKEGTSFPLTLQFKSGAEVNIDVMVMSPSAMGGAMNHGAMSHGHMNQGAGNAMEHAGSAMKHMKDGQCQHKDQCPHNAQCPQGEQCQEHKKMHGAGQ